MTGSPGPGRAGALPISAMPSPRLGPADFARLYQQSWRVLWCVAAGIVGNRSAAEDVVQQSAVVGLERLDQFDPETSFVAWMVRIVKNTALNEARKKGRRKTALAETSVLDATPGRDAEAGPPVIDGRGELREDSGAFDDALLRALRRLEETARACLLMRVVLDMPYRDIALALAIPEGTAASHVHRARAALRDELREGAGSSTGRKTA